MSEPSVPQEPRCPSPNLPQHGHASESLLGQSVAGQDERVNPYGAPVQASDHPAGPPHDPMAGHQDDITLTEPTALVKAGAFLAMATGLILTLVGLQLLLTVTLVGPVLERIPLLLLLGGPAIMALGWKTYNTRGWAALGAMMGTSLTALGMGYWVLFTASAGYFSLLALALPPLAVVAAVFSGLAMGPCRRADAARARLQEAGIDMTF